MSNNNHIQQSSKIDVRKKVMDKIRGEGIKIRSPFYFVAQKLGLESALILSVVGGAFLVSVLLYFLKKTKLLKFLVFGWPGLKIFLLTLPYDYIALFIITVLLANYIVKKLDLSVKKIISVNIIVIFLFLVSVFLGTFFAVIGMEQIARGWSHNRIPRATSISGRVIDFSDQNVMVEEENGEETRVIFVPKGEPGYTKGKFLRALGQRDLDDENVFHAEDVDCCDD